MAANLAESTKLADQCAPIPHADGNGRTWREIDHLVEELAALAQADVSPEAFYAALLDKSLAALAAIGGAVWQLPVNGPATLLTKVNFPPDLVSSVSFSGRRKTASDQAATVLFVPRGRGDKSSTAPQDCETPLVISSLRNPDGTATVIEIALARDLSPEALQGAVKLLDVFREVAAEFGRGRELAALRRRGADLRQFDEFVLRVHDSLDLVTTAYAVANDGRLWIGCDRVSVARVDQGMARVLAVSGVDQVDRRSAEVGGLERLAAAVALSKEPLVWPESQSRELPPQIDHALQAHLDVGHARRLIVTPLRRRGVKEADADHPIQGVLIAESFDERLDANVFRERTHDVARHGGAALLAALAHHDLPLLPLQVKLGRLLRIMRQRRVAVLLIVALVFAVVGLLAVVPADFSIEARGTLQPEIRRHLFAPADGVVENVLAEHGAKVAQGEPLLLLRDPRLDLDYSRVSGELQTAQARLDAVQAKRSSRNTSPDAREEARQLAAEEEQLKEQVRGLETQQQQLSKLHDALRVTSPISGVVLTWNTKDVLQDRPVKQGQALVTVADPAGPWVLEVRVPDADVGHLLAAQQHSGSPLPVSFLLATDPAATHRGQIERVALATDMASDDSPGALTIVRIAGERPGDARAGTGVTARIHCGRRSIGYVWLHDLIDAIRTQVLSETDRIRTRSREMRRCFAVWLTAVGLGLGGPAAAADIAVESVVINLVAEVEVPANEAGSLVEVPAAEGRRVEAGAVLARIDDRDAALEVAAAEIALDHAQQQAANDVKLRLARQALKLAELELKKAEDANRELERVVSATQIEKLRIEVEKAQLEIELAVKDLAAAERTVAAAKNALLVAQRGMERRKIVAPIGGTVVDVRRRLGEWLEPGATVVRLVRDDRLRAEGFVHVEKLTADLRGQAAELVVTLPGEKPTTFRGTVTFVSPEVNPINRQVRVWAEFDNADGRLRPGLPARLTVKVSSGTARP